MLDNLRPPSHKELIAAWRSLMESKLRYKVPLNCTQALQCGRLLQYLTKPGTSEQNAKLLNMADLSIARQVLLDIEPIERGEEHAELARIIHSAASSGEVSGKSRHEPTQWCYLVRALSRFGDAKGAVRELYARWDDPEYTRYISSEDRVLDDVLQGLALEGAEKELVELINFALKKDIPYNFTMQRIATAFFATRDRVPETKEWFTKPLGSGQCQLSTYRTIASFARRNQLEDWALPFFQELSQLRQVNKRWNTLLPSMLLLGVPLEEVQGMMSHMVGRDDSAISPDIYTINSLLKVATETVDPDLATRIIAIAEELDISHDEYTHLLLLDLHVSSGSVRNSATAFQSLQDTGSISPNASINVWKEYSDIMNKYLVMLGEKRPPDFEFILKLLSAVEEEKIHLKPETVASLCLRFLENDQTFDVMDILSIHAFRYSHTQREVVQNSFVTFCQDENTSTARAWGAYQLLQQFFQDLSFERRVLLLQVFFDRKRPDMATFVFGHMRQHQVRAYQPTLDTYVQCFEGYANHPDREGAETVHNMFKMDTRVRPDTRTYTAMMLAFAMSGMPRRALQLWSLVQASREGPSYATLEAVFLALEKTPNGDKQAREVWRKIESMDLEVPLSVYNGYIAAVAASGNEKEARGLIMKTATDIGTQPDTMTFGLVYNALPGLDFQKNFKEWAEKRFSEQWAELMKIRRRTTEHGLCEFKLNRILKA